jgi:hypothetical protein
VQSIGIQTSTIQTSRLITRQSVIVAPSTRYRFILLPPVLLRSYAVPKDDSTDTQITILVAAYETSVAPSYLGLGKGSGMVPLVNPIFSVFKEAERLWPARVREAVLISIGPGPAPPPSLRAQDHARVAEQQEIATCSDKLGQNFLQSHTSIATSSQYFRFNVDLVLPIELQEEEPH